MFNSRGLQAGLLSLCLLAGGALHAQGTAHVTQGAHESRLPQLRGLVLGCTADAKLCTPDKVGPDETFVLRSGLETEVHYAWLRQTLAGMGKQKPEDRQKTAQAALQKLSLGDAPLSSVAVDPARAGRVAAEVLSQVEFSKSGQSWLSRQWNRLMDWLYQHMNIPAPAHGTQRWLRFLAEALLFGLPLLLLALWLMRQVKDDRLRPESTGPAAARKAQGGDVPWLELAQQCAQRGEWREAVHALYWQMVSTLEGRRLLSVSRTRTPRESLRLLDTQSSARPLLREQTMLLERVWYGQTPATEQDYRRAQLLQEEVLRA